LNFIRKLLKSGGASKASTLDARGAAPVQSQGDQDATRARMEAEMAEQKERREPHDPAQ
jgi:hypothetical protein